MTASNMKSGGNNDVFKALEVFGRFQTVQYVLICLPLFGVSMLNVNYIFVAENVNYRCRVPTCEGENPTIDTPPWWPEKTDPTCFRPVLDLKKYNAANQTCSNNTFLDLLEECDEWIYETNNSIVAELNLGCQPWKATLVGCIHNAGMVFSMILTGWIADKIGRMPTIIICSVGGTIGVLKIFLTNYYAYLAVEFLESVLASGLYTVCVVLLIEVGGETKRVLAGVIFSYAVYVGEVTFAFTAMGLQYWKHLIITIYSPMILFVFYVFFLRESTRWQMLLGKMDGAKDTLKKVAKMNKLNISSKEIDDINDEELRRQFNVEIQIEKESMKDVFASKEIMIRLAVTSVCFFTSSFLYYGLAVHSVMLPGNKYINFVLSAVTSFPGDMVAFYTFNKYGRRVTLQYGYLLSAVSLMAQAYSPDSIAWLKVSLFLIGKLGVVICFTGIYTYSLELFPTSVRGSLIGVGNTAARIGSMLAPLTPLLVTQFESLPSMLFSSTAVIAALLLTFTPETKTLPMFDTVAQVEAHEAKISTHL